MADQELVEHLKRGHWVWNPMRSVSTIRPDLSYADLKGANLSRYNLSDANLYSAKLDDANLRGANLSGANLSDANLRGADLSIAEPSNPKLNLANLNEVDEIVIHLGRPANLTYAKLIGANLGGANLMDANLYGAHLNDANLSDAKLGGAHLNDPNLNGANLSDADLRGADLSGAKLSGADLSGAILNDATLIKANLSGANLSGANMAYALLLSAYLNDTNLNSARLIEANFSRTIFAGVDLTSVIGLESCVHGGPSIVDYRTLERSGRLPLSFLRGVGLPDKFIDYLPSLLDQPIQHYSCFISYSAKDQEFAERLHVDLQNKGVRCWFARHHLRIGDKILDEIDAAIRLRDKVLLILSEQSIKSDWVEDELTAAFEEESKRGQIVLFPIRLDETVMKTNRHGLRSFAPALSVTSSTGEITTPTRMALSACCAI
jgi:uncharacterized protein YjbI with pentapeptide repeats